MNPPDGQATLPPQGWYPDPSDPAAARFWDGQSWTSDTRAGQVDKAAAEPVAERSIAAATPPMGWYPDPAGGDEERYWDGQRWTRNTREPLDQPDWQAGLGSAAKTAAAPEVELAPVPTARQWDHVAMEWRDLPLVDPVKRTEDGVQLGGWWRRLVGRLIDDLIILILVGAICFQQWRRLQAAVSQWWAENGALLGSGRVANLNPLVDQITGDQTTIWMVTLIVTCMSASFFHHRYGATPGQLLMKLRVVPLGQGRHQGGLGLLASIRRGAAVAIILAMTGIFPLVRLLDGLVAAFGDRGQTTHDWLGRTQVIDARFAPQQQESPDADAGEASAR